MSAWKYGEPDGISFEITGIDEVCQQLDELPLVVVKKCYAEALDAACVPVLEALQGNIPKLTGDLRAHVMFVIETSPDGQGAYADIGFGDAGWKARLVEYGHRMVGHEPEKKELGVVRPHPFMRVAFETAAENSIEAFAARLMELINYEVIVIDNRTAA